MTVSLLTLFHLNPIFLVHKTAHEGFIAKPSLSQFIHKLSKNRNALVSTATGSQLSHVASLKTINNIKNETRFRNKTSFNFDSPNYNKHIRKTTGPAFFTKFMTGKSPSALLHPPYEPYDEKRIQEEYRFKLPVLIPPMENENIYINVLMGFPHSFEFIEVFLFGKKWK